MFKIIRFKGESKRSLLRNGVVGTKALEVRLNPFENEVNLYSLKSNGMAHTGRLSIPADPDVLRSVAEALIKAALIVEDG